MHDEGFPTAVEMFDSSGKARYLGPGLLWTTQAQRTNNCCWFTDESHLTIVVDAATGTLTTSVGIGFNPSQANFQTQHVYMRMNYATSSRSGDYHTVNASDKGLFAVGGGGGGAAD